MAKKRRRKAQPALVTESRGVETLTVGWMLTVMTTLACSATAGLIWLAVHDREDYETALSFARYLHFCAIVTAIVSLILMGVVLYGRRVSPPLSISIGAAIIAVLPILAALL